LNELLHLTLRTTDVSGARTFYESVLGAAPSSLVQLHEQAVARGAPPHWLGFIEVDDVAGVAARFLERGAQALSPKWVNPEGLEAQVLRDPGGAVVALGKPATRKDETPRSTMHLLNTTDVERAKTNYRELFGWSFAASIDLGPLGVIRPFSFREGGPTVGAFVGIEGRAGVHPHWLFHFTVPSIDAALEQVRAAGGKALGPFTLHSGTRVAVCDDAQGAAFALREG
jgi:predicted enzyme related to lactoylglutathione lyase